MSTSLQDAEYENELLQRVTDESRTVEQLVSNALDEMDTYGDGHTAIWLGSFITNRPRTQVQLVVTQKPELMIDED